MTKTRLSKRVLALLLTMVMIMSFVPIVSFNAQENLTPKNKVSDLSTANDWQKYFGINTPGGVNTTNAGRIWGDKSVFTSNTTLGTQTVNLTDSNNFLVALSAIASNKTIVGYSTIPTDTVLVLDLSNSMSTTDLSSMVTAANNAINRLLTLNKNNRVGVVVYAGNAGFNGSYNLSNSSDVILPIDRYTGVTSGYGENATVNYIRYANGRYSVVNGVRDGDNQLISGSSNVGGATYMQAGAYTAWQEFDKITDTTVNVGVQKDVKRMPVVVLMSDGAPTVATTDYTNVGNHNRGTGSSSSATAENGFVTQLTMSWLRGKLETKYDNDVLFYTLGLGVGNNDVAKSVLDPLNTNVSDMNTYWSTYLDTAYSNGTTITMGSGNSRFSVIKDANVKTKDYVNEYFAASNSAGLINAFGLIVNHIILQSKYYPTHVSNGEHALDGYITFNDELGEYMEVKEIKGVLAEGKTYTGAAVAKAIAKGSFGDLTDGDLSSLTYEGVQVLKAVQKRLGCTEKQAEDVIAAALKSGQLSYTSETEYSNYIGWYADADGKYLGFWDGKSTDNAISGAKYANRSYGFLGSVGSAENHDQTDMLYISVQVHKDITTGHETVIYKIPAVLVPMVTYSISFEGEELDQTARNIKMTVSNPEPIRLVYETGLRSDINELNITEKIPSTGLNAYEHVNNGVYTFYTNDFGDENSIDPANHDATWLDFEPSLENERYYYMDHEIVYDASYNPVTSDPRNMSGPFYHRFTRIRLTGNGDEAELYYDYEPISSTTLSLAKFDGTTWYIPEGTPYRVLENYRVAKQQNNTNTLTYSNYLLAPVPATQTGGNYRAYAYLGNNGRFEVVPAQGIVISKECDYIPAAGTEFEFVINLTAPAGSSLQSSYPVTKFSANNEKTLITANVNAASQIVVTLKAGEKAYITGLEAGVDYTVNEIVAGKDYKVKSINGQSIGTAYSGTIQQYVLAEVDYVNTLRTDGNLVITKYIEHPFGNDTPTALYNKQFNVKVDLGIAHAGHSVKVDGVDTTVGNDGSIDILIKGNQSVIISGIDSGTVYTVTENNLSNGFTLSTDASKTNGLTGTIVQDANQYATLTNVYAPTEVYPVNVNIEGLKELEGRDWLTTDEFEFSLQYFNGSSWESVANHTADKQTVNSSDKNIIFSNAIQNMHFNKEGVYQFRIIELRDNVGGVTYDHTERHFSLVVTDSDIDGKYEISEVKVTTPTGYVWDAANSTHKISFAFNNKYAPLGNAAIQIDITKVLEDSANTGMLPEGFKFGLYDGQTLVAESTETDQAGKASIRMVYAATLLKPATGNIAELELNYILKEIIPDPAVVGMEYDRTEHPVKVVLKDNLDGSISATVQVGNATNVTPIDKDVATFTNKYVLTGVTDTQITGTKTLGNDPIKANKFKFTLKNEDGSEKETVFCDTNGNFAFSAITYDKVGTYRYKIVEVDTLLGNVNYDTTVYDVVVEVTDGGNGKLVASRTITKEGETTPSAVVFANSVKATSVDFKINVDKTIDNRTQETVSKNGFAFILEMNGQTLDTVYTDANGDAEFTLQFNNANVGNTYTYKVYERNDAVSGYTYSTVEYTYTISVEYDDEYNVITVVSGNKTTSAQASFTNIYELEGTSVTLSGIKNFDLGLNGGEFSFVLKDENGTPIQTVQNKADKTYSFNAISYTKTGVYKYTVSEYIEGLSGIKYDTNVYDVTVTVSVGQGGKLEADTTVRLNNTPVSNLDFTNDFDPTSVNLMINIDKDLENKTKEEMGLNGFKFVLKDENGSVVKEIETDAYGKAVIALNYAEADANKTYKYTLSEVDTGISGIKYSTDVKEFTVNVKVGSDYQIYTEVNGVNTSDVSASFTNVYELESAKVTFDGKKTFDYRLESDLFSFVLKDANGKDVEIVKNKADGTFSFTELVFDKTGTYKYTISEVDGKLSGITYDKDVYNVTVTVTIGENGKLVADVLTTVNENTQNVDIEFDNKFTPKETAVEIVIQKEIQNLTEEKVSAKDFEFTLVDGQGKVVGKFKTGDDGKAVIKLVYDKADADKTYTYKLSEVDTLLPGFEYSDKVYEYTVKITVDENYNLVSEVLRDGKAENALENAVFVNLYEGIDPPPQTGADIYLTYWLPVMLVSGMVFVGLALTSDNKKKAK